MDVYENIEEYNPNKKQKILIVSDDMISDILRDKRLNSIVTELFIRGRELDISLVFITILFRCTGKYQTKFKTLFYYKNSKQTKIETDPF